MVAGVKAGGSYGGGPAPGRPFGLVLGGPAGGWFTVGSGGPNLEIDAVEFVRALSGRGARPEMRLISWASGRAP